jgi:hypothetical protein
VKKLLELMQNTATTAVPPLGEGSQQKRQQI